MDLPTLTAGREDNFIGLKTPDGIVLALLPTLRFAADQQEEWAREIARRCNDYADLRDELDAVRSELEEVEAQLDACKEG